MSSEFPKFSNPSERKVPSEKDFDGFASGVEGEEEEDLVWTPEVLKQLSELRLHMDSLSTRRIHPDFVSCIALAFPQADEKRRYALLDLYLRANALLSQGQKPELSITPQEMRKIYQVFIAEYERMKNL